jgi:hypothetical protein
LVAVTVNGFPKAPTRLENSLRILAFQSRNSKCFNIVLQKARFGGFFISKSKIFPIIKQ